MVLMFLNDFVFFVDFFIQFCIFDVFVVLENVLCVLIFFVLLPDSACEGQIYVDPAEVDDVRALLEDTLFILQNINIIQ